MNHALGDDRNFEDWLITRKRNRHHRQLVWISGDRQWVNQSAERVLQLTESGHDIWVGERQGKAQKTEHNQVLSILGSEYSNAVYEVFHQFNLNALFAIVGTVRANGLVLLLTPDIKHWANKCQSIPSQSHGYKSEQSNFIRYFCEHLKNDNSVLKLFQHDTDFRHQHFPAALSTPLSIQRPDDKTSLSQEQSIVAERVMQQLDQQSPYAAVIIAKRGRGKSWLLGWLVQSLIEKQCSVALVAPQAKSTNQVFSHLSTQRRNPLFTYCAPDDPRLSTPFDWVIIDEAAAIPVPLLRRIADKQRQCLFATTIGGYEGSGSGFLHRFIEFLKASTKQKFDQFNLIEPMRWYRGDYLEHTIDSILAPPDDTLPCHIDTSNMDKIELRFERISKHRLVNDAKLALQIYTILASAHYQTTPNDFVRQFDAEDSIIFVLTQLGHVVAAALCIIEGGTHLTKLKNEIAAGARRVKGHLTAQYMSYNTTNGQFCQFRYLRINRIAVAPNMQSKGLGSILVKEITQFARDSKVDIVSTTFGSLPRLNSFWESNQFTQFQLGQKVDKASGLYSALYLMALTKETRQCIETHRVLSEAQQTQKLMDFASGTRNLSSIRHALKFHEHKFKGTVSEGCVDTLLYFVANSPSIDEATIVKRFDLSGKKQLTKKLREAIRTCLG